MNKSRDPVAREIPPSMRAVVNAIGQDKAIKLMLELGGTVVYVPREAKSTTKLVAAIGSKAAADLALEFGGTHLEIPVGGRAVTLWLSATGLNNNEIARIQKTTAKTVGKRLASVRDALPDLFDRT